MKTVDLLVKARRVLLRHGWTQGTYRDREGQFCATGAIRKAAGLTTPFGCVAWDPMPPAVARASKYLANAMGVDYAARYNDTPGRLKGEVILAFDKAIKNAKRRHPLGD